MSPLPRPSDTATGQVSAGCDEGTVDCIMTLEISAEHLVLQRLRHARYQLNVMKALTAVT